jgi:1-acyl-sn-glycerol-3-phosphate acyltransferase
MGATSTKPDGGPAEEKFSSSQKDNETDSKFMDLCSCTVDGYRQLANGTAEDREKASCLVTEVSKDQILSTPKMTFLEELSCVLFMALGVPNGIFTFPVLVFLIGKFIVGNVKSTYVMAFVILLPFAIVSQDYIPSTLQSWLSIQVVRYFSFRMIFEERPVKEGTKNYRPRIMVAPPHGVFPYGNILAMLTYPCVCGGTFRGLAASSALRPPGFKQILRSIGIIDASRHIARKTLENGESLGISTGGVAEVFETNKNDECILLKQRIGLIKLAIRTGSDLVPCYLFGNTKLLSCWAGEGVPKGRDILEYISRKVGFALIFIYGRFGLPVPRRVPILAVMGKPISTYHIKCEEPTLEQIQEIQTLLIDEMQDIFDRYKGLYGWEDKHLIIK